MTASAAAGMLASEGHAALILTINTLTPDEFSFTLSGTFDTDVVGDQRQWLAAKNNWTNNFGQNVDWIDDSVGVEYLEFANITVIENSVRFNGLIPPENLVAADGRPWGDSFYFGAGFDITAGTTVSGTLTVRGPGIFDDSVTNLELLSGLR